MGVRVFWSDTKLPPAVVHTNVKLGPEEEAAALSIVCGKAQVNCAGEAMAVVGGGNCVIETVAVTEQMVAPLTVTV